MEGAAHRQGYVPADVQNLNADWRVGTPLIERR